MIKIAIRNPGSDAFTSFIADDKGKRYECGNNTMLYVMDERELLSLVSGQMKAYRLAELLMKDPTQGQTV